MAMIPDLLGSWLTGVVEAEETNASTTGLYDPAGRAWDDELIGELGLPRAIFGPIARPGKTLGPIRQAVAEFDRPPGGDTGPACRVARHRLRSGRGPRRRR